MKTSSRLVGLTLLAFPLVVQVPFGLLAATFSYPDILTRSADEVLTRFQRGGETLVWTWYGYALCTLGLLFAAVELPSALGQGGVLARLSVWAGALSAAAQLLGLLRWVFVVPFLAEQWVAQPEAHLTLTCVYEVQHRLFGVLLGEHVGQLLLGAWTGLAAMLWRRAGRGRLVAWLGFVSAAGLGLGLAAGLSRVVALPAVFQHVPLVAFIAWTVWAVSTGAGLVRERPRA
jgi:hypothetical protein